MKKFLLLLCFLSCVVNFSYAEDMNAVSGSEEISIDEAASAQNHKEVVSNKLTLAQAIELAVEKNVELNQKRKDLEIAKNNIKIANRLQNPSFEMAYGLGKTNGGNPQQIGLSQLFEIGKRSQRKKMAQIGYSLSDDILKYAEFDVRMDVREAFINLAAAKSKLKNIEQQKDLLEKLVYIAKKRVDAGASAEMDLMQARIVLNQLNLKENSAKAEVLSAKYDFNKALNVDRSQEDNTFYDINEDYLPDNSSFISVLTPSPQRVMPKFDDIAEMAYKNRFDLKISQKEIDVAKKNLDVTIRQRIPDIELSGGYAYLTSHQNDGNGMVSGAYAQANLVNLPILYNYSPEIKNAKLQLEQAQLQFESAKNIAVNNLMSAYEKFLVAQKNLNYYNSDLLSDSKEIVDMAAKSYEVGKSDLTSLVVVQQSYCDIMSGYIEALSDYYVAWIDFLRESNDEGFMLDEKSNL